MRSTRHRFEFFSLVTLALPVVTGSLTAQTRYLNTVAGPIDSVVSTAQSVLFGFLPNNTTGVMDTFSWNAAAWTAVATTGAAPAARQNQFMAGAPGGGFMMFGGSPVTATPVTTSTHLFNGSAWSTLNLTPSPSLRTAGGCAQLGNGNVVLFGGSNATGLLGDTWIFNGTSWTQLNIPGPTPRLFPAMGSDGNGNALLFGGFDTTSTTVNDTWLFNGTSWTQLFPATSPPPRFGAALAADPKRALPGVANRTSVVLAGGFDIVLGVPFVDCWVFLAGNWTQQPFTTSAIGGFGTCAFDGVHREVLFAEFSVPTGAYVVGEFGFTNYGSGCACSSGVPAMVPSVVPPRLGLTTSWNVAGGVPGSFVFLVVDFAPANIPWSTACTQLVGPNGTTVGFGLNGAGAGAVGIAVPASPTFVGTTLYGQVIDVVNFCGSDALEMRAGR